MFRPRIIPCLLLKDKGLVKTVKFKNPRYIGDPLNAVRIFNKKMADELIFLDINATKENRDPNLELIKNIGEECMMPFAVGGGIRNMQHIESILKAGAEKVIINTEAIKNPQIIRDASSFFGRQAIIVSIDVKKNIFGNFYVYTKNGTKSTGFNPFNYIKLAEMSGAGEIFVTSIDRDGTYKGYDIELIKGISEKLEIPVIANGGASKIDDFRIVWEEGNAFASAAGSLFTFHGKKRAVLINYPTKQEKIDLFN